MDKVDKGGKKMKEKVEKPAKAEVVAEKASKAKKGEHERKLVEYLQSHGGEARRRDIAKDLGDGYGPKCYSLKKKGIITDFKKDGDSAVWFKLV